MALIKINRNIHNETDIEYLYHRVAVLENQLASLQEGKLKSSGLMIHSNGVHHLVFPNQVKYLTSESNYSYIFLKSGLKIFTSKTLKYWLGKFDSNSIIRVHRGVAVNAAFISKINKPDKTILLDDDTVLPYSRSFELKTYFM